MAPFASQLFLRRVDAASPADEFRDQWRNPGDIFSLLLLLGGEVVGRALAQLAGSRVTPVAFSFGWVTYSLMAVSAIIGERRLMPEPDCSCKVINGRNGHVRDNSSWVIGRIVRDFESWMSDSRRGDRIATHVQRMRKERWERNRQAAEKAQPGSGSSVPRPPRVGLCVCVFKAGVANPGTPGKDLAYYLGFVTALLQLGIAAIPCGIYRDWSALFITAVGTILSLATGSLKQWGKEKWACRRNSKKTVVLARGNGSQFAIVVIGDGKGLDLEDLATGVDDVPSSSSRGTQFMVAFLAFCWVMLLITATGVEQNTWYLIAIGGIGILHNLLVAGRSRAPEDFGIPLALVEVIGKGKVMETLLEVETRYPRLGRSMRDVFFSGDLRPAEAAQWDALEAEVEAAESQPVTSN